MDHRKKPGSPGDILAHHGVKGMRWGVRKEEEPLGRDSSGKIVPPTGSGKVTSADSVKAAEYNRLANKIVEQSGLDSHLMAAKYGPPGMQRQVEKQHQADREKLKKVAIGLGIGVGVAGLGYAAYKLHQDGVDFEKITPRNFQKIWTENLSPHDNKLFTLDRTKGKAYQSAINGLNLNWDNGVDLPKGSVLRRLSTVAETVARPDGFFAAFRDEDVESYKAILPTFWGSWGVGSAEKGGFLNHYMAKERIRAPSGKESFELFKHLIDTDDSFNEHFVSLWDKAGGRGKSDAVLKQVFLDTSQTWASSNNPYTQHWFKELKARGYNAVIDFNDAGKLGKTPLRVIDGKMFDIVKNEPVSLDDFYQAAQNWSPELIHVFTLPNGDYILVHVDEFRSRIKIGHEAVSSGRFAMNRTIEERRVNASL